jgi:CBS domain-containing protein
VKIKELMTPEVKCCSEFSTLNTAAQIMWENDLGCLPIVDKDRRVTGMLTDRDICMSAYLQGGPLAGALVTGAMSKEVFFCREEEDVAAAEKLMTEKQIHRLPVLDSAGRAVGVISLNDIARQGARRAQSPTTRQISEAEIVQTIALVCAPRQPIDPPEADRWPAVGLAERWLARNHEE